MTDFYINVWQGAFEGTDEELSLLLSRSCDIVNNAIAFSGYTVETVPEIYKDRVYKAVCSHADYIDSIGGVECMSESGYSSASLGKFSYSADGSADNSPFNLCQLARGYLAPTGLLYRGVWL